MVATIRSVSIISLALLLVSVAFAVAGQLILKAAMDHVGRISALDGQTLGTATARAIRQPLLWTGLALFGISSLFWLVVLSRVPLSLAYPFVGISYLLVVAFAALVQHEHVPVLRWAGVGVIVAGIVIVGLSFVRSSP